MRRASGCLIGLALGDALGAPLEFLSYPEIRRRARRPEALDLAGDPALVTDDTQMALAVGEALRSAPVPYAPAALEGPLRAAFVAWYHSPDNTRAPGNTCLQACAGLAAGRPWTAATVAGSKGAGAVMRVPPVGLLAPGTEERAAVAQFQAALTHGHPTALTAADLVVAAIADLAGGGDPAGLPARLRAYGRTQAEVYHASWLGPLWQRPGATSPADFIRRGWEECLSALDRLDQALATPDDGGDPCGATGEAWVAEEAVATALLCFLRSPEDGLAAIRRAAMSSGDSDTIACLAGAFAGAHLGLAAWPPDWVRRIEYRQSLLALGRAWD